MAAGSSQPDVTTGCSGTSAPRMNFAADYVDRDDVGVAAAAGDVLIFGPAGRTEDIAGKFEVLDADARAAPHLHMLPEFSRPGEQDDREFSVSCVDPGLRAAGAQPVGGDDADRKSTCLNSSHLGISYAVFC